MSFLTAPTTLEERIEHLEEQLSGWGSAILQPNDLTVLPNGQVLNYSDLLDVRRFGAQGDGIHDDTAALQTAINWAIVGSHYDTRVAPMPVVDAQAALWIPPGSYKTSSPLQIYAVRGLTVLGAGRLAAEIQFGGSGHTTNLLDVNGATLCSIGGFSLNGGGNALAYPKSSLLNVDAISSVASGSSESCRFFDIYGQGYFDIGLAYGVGNPANSNSQDVYHHLFEQVHMIGSQGAGAWSSAPWQTAFLLGKAGAPLGNVLHPHFINCNGNSCINGVEHHSVGCEWEGGCLQENKWDVYVTAAPISDPLSYRGFRSENSQMLLGGTGGPGVAASASFRDIQWYTNYSPAGGQVVLYTQGGVLVFDGVTLYSTNPADNLNAYVAGSGAGALLADFRNVAVLRADQNPAPTAWLFGRGGSNDLIKARNIGAIKTDGTGQVGATYAGA